MTIVAAIQMCSSYSVDENLRTAQNFIFEAAKNDAKLIVLPEMFAMIGSDAADKIIIKEKFGHYKIQCFLSEQCERHSNLSGTKCEHRVQSIF